MKTDDKDFMRAYIQGLQDCSLFILAYTGTFLSPGESRLDEEDFERYVSMCRRILEHFDDGRASN